MKNIMKLCLLLTLCAALLLVVGCAKKDADDDTQPPAQEQTQGTEDGAGTTEATVDAAIGENPEGDPFDGMDAAEDLGEDEGGPEETTEAEPPVGIDDDTEPTEDDFVVDFGDLT